MKADGGTHLLGSELANRFASHFILHPSAFILSPSAFILPPSSFPVNLVRMAASLRRASDLLLRQVCQCPANVSAYVTFSSGCGAHANDHV